MSPLTAPLRQHHTHCDNLFAEAEEAVAKGDWPTAERRMAIFATELETHFQTEEDTLFPAFETATGMTGGPTQMMRFEHAQMRELAGQMNSALAGRQAGDFAGIAETLLILMQQHNMKEENILYPMCDRGLAAQAGTLAPILDERLSESCRTT